ncbi:hypothetical protein [Thermodesulfovibrio hydrogeniphilus]
MPATLEERVAYLEGKVEEHTTGLRDVKEMFIHIEGKFLLLEQRLFETNKRIDSLNDTLTARINSLNDTLTARINSLNDTLTARIEETNKRIDKLFYFILASLVSSIGSLIGIIISLVVK